MKMRIVFIGAGRLATNLALALTKAGHDVVQVYSRTQESASELAGRLGTGVMATCQLNEVVRDADVYIVAVKDAVLASLIPELCKGREEAVFLHTAGSMPMALFEGYARHYGVFYPMQSFSKERLVDFRQLPIFIEGCDERTLTVAGSLAHSVSQEVRTLSSEDRRYLHLAAVFACNFTNHCYALAAQVLERHGLPFNVMLPLIDETAEKVHQMAPIKAQTGPAVRYDVNVIRAQMELLAEMPEAQRIYEQMSESIHLAAIGLNEK